MNIIKLDQFNKNFEKFKQFALQWKIFIYPTDTIYWIWSILSKKLVEKIYNIKSRDKKKPFSVIAPNVEWIKNNFLVNKNFEDELEQYLEKNHWITLILKKIKENFIKYIWLNNTVWVRILKHKFQDFVSYLWQPFITTSANFSWKSSPWKFEELDKNLFEKVDFVIDWWTLNWKQSVLINYYEK